MSEIKVDTLTGKTTANDITVTVGATATQSLHTGLVKAWAVWDTDADDPPVANGSFGVSSLTDQTTEVNFNLTSAMSDAYYSPVGSAGGPTLTNPANRNLGMNVQSTTIVGTEIYTTANAQDTGHSHVGVLGDLA